uniref:Uncharacterized protein n=1 Tax=Romanomermis culicivorax TaxID=13658 RepID=A0A915IRJ4_ROMCU
MAEDFWTGFNGTFLTIPCMGTELQSLFPIKNLTFVTVLCSEKTINAEKLTFLTVFVQKTVSFYQTTDMFQFFDRKEGFLWRLAHFSHNWQLVGGHHVAYGFRSNGFIALRAQLAVALKRYMIVTLTYKH